MGALQALAKAIIGFLSCLFFCVGVAFFAIVALVAVDFKTYAEGGLFKEVYLWGPVGVGAVVGVMLLLCGTFGLIGVCCEKRGFLKAFSIALSILIILEITAGVLIYVYRSKLDDELATGIRKALPLAFGNGTQTKVAAAVNKLQTNLACCAGNGTSDYTSQNLTVPLSCCTNAAACNATGPFVMEGCTTKLTNLYRKYANIVFGIAIGFAFLELVGVLYSCCISGREEYA